MNRELFEQMHRDNTMAKEQLTQGIKGFSDALMSLEALLANRLSEIGENNNPVIAAP